MTVDGRGCSRADEGTRNHPPGARSPESAASRRDTRRSALLVACAALSLGLCVWGSIGWRRAYRAQIQLEHLFWAEQLRDDQLLRIIERGGEAAAQLTVEGRLDVYPARIFVDGE